MADQYLVNLVTTAELTALVNANDGAGALKEGLQYKNTDTGKLYVALSSNSYERVFTYKSYVGYLRPRGIEGTAPAEQKVLVIGETYVIPTLNGSDFSNVGFVEEGVSFVATGTTPTLWGVGTRVMCVTDNPIDTIIIENTLGDIAWSGSNGWYDGILTGAFPYDKTITIPFGDVSYLPILTPNEYTPFAHYAITRNDENGVGLWIVDLNGNPLDIWQVCYPYLKIYVEIRVYN